MKRLVLALVLLLAACSGSTGGASDAIDASPDAGPDAVLDSADATPSDVGPETEVGPGDTLPDPGSDPGGDPGTDPGGDTTPGAAFRLAVLSDPTLLENDMYRWNSRLDEAVAAINADPSVELVLVLGDVAAYIDDMWEVDPGPGTWEGALALAVEALGALDAPYYVVPGEKDYAEVVALRPHRVTWADTALRTQALKAGFGPAFPGDEPWFSFDHQGVRFVAANTAVGPHAHDANGMTGSLGADQIAALDDALGGAGAAIALFHHRPDMLVDDGDGLGAALTANASRLLALFSGHLWSYHEYELAGVPGYAFDAVNEAPAGHPYVAFVDVDPVARTVTVANRADLPYPAETPAGSVCTPGDEAIGVPQGLEDTYHVVFFDQLDVDDPLLAQLFSSADLGETPYAFHVTTDHGNLSYDVVAKLAANFHSYSNNGTEVGGDHAVVCDYSKADAPCTEVTLAFDDPCMIETVPIAYDLLLSIDPDGLARMCGLTMPYAGDVSLTVRLGDDAARALTLAEGQISARFEKPLVLETLKRYFVDAYCANDCSFDWIDARLMPQEGCLPAANGHTAACAAGTLTFDEVPASCDTSLGSNYQVSLRTILKLADHLPDEATLTLTGWGHRMTLSADSKVDWSINPEVFSFGSCQDVH